MKKNRFGFAALLLLAAFPVMAESRPATNAEIAMVREGMQERLKDADSAKFRNVRFGNGEHKSTVCGDVNAKNSYGAFGGFVSFMGAYISPDDYTDSATVKRAPSIYILGVDDEAGGAASMVCKEKGI